jgi:hypothetical protein
MEEIYKHQRKEYKKEYIVQSNETTRKTESWKNNGKEIESNYGEKPKYSSQTVKNFKGVYKQQLWRDGEIL